MTLAVLAWPDIIALVSLFVWLMLLIGWGGFWRADQRLPGIETEPESWPSVLAVIPARDEAEVIGPSIASVLGQDYPGELTVVLSDDASSDGTADLARAAANGAPRSLDVVEADAKPAGWTGKVWAIESALRSRQDQVQRMDFVWLTDADIVHPADGLRRLVAKAESGGLDLVSLMVRLHCRTFWEILLVPAFVFFFQKLYPFGWANDPRRATAAAAGGCILLRRTALDRIGGLTAISNELIDDCALARAVKAGGRIWIGLTAETASIRPYRRLSDLWAMVTRTAFHQLRYSVIRLVGTVVGMALLYLVPPVTGFAPLWGGGAVGGVAGLVALALMIAAYTPTLGLYRLPAWHGLLLPVAATFYTLMTLDSARRHWLGKGGTWKARPHVPEARGG